MLVYLIMCHFRGIVHKGHSHRCLGADVALGNSLDLSHGHKCVGVPRRSPKKLVDGLP